MRYYIADLHFFHGALNEKMDKRGFESTQAMNEYMLDQWNRRVGKNDEVVILGDFGASIYRQPPQPRINQGFLETRKLNLKPYNHMVNAFSTRNGRFSLSGLTGKGLIKWQYSG